MLDINLHTLAGIEHLFIGPGNVFGIGRFYRRKLQSFKNAPQAGDGAGVAALHEFYPKDDEPGMRVSSAHVTDELNFLLRMLRGMRVRSSGTVPERVPGAVIAAFPAVNILTVGFVFYSNLRDTMFFSIID